MKSVLRLTAAGVALATFGFSSNAMAATANAPATATILQPLTVALDTGATVNRLDFGTIAVNGAVAGTVALSLTNVRTCSASLTCIGTTAVPNFDITGAPSLPVTITVPATVTLNSGANSMTANLTSSAASLTLSGGGAGTFDVAGTLNVGATQAAGVYSGTFTVTVVYS